MEPSFNPLILVSILLAACSAEQKNEWTMGRADATPLLATQLPVNVLALEELSFSVGKRLRDLSLQARTGSLGIWMFPDAGLRLST